MGDSRVVVKEVLCRLRLRRDRLCVLLRMGRLLELLLLLMQGGRGLRLLLPGCRRLQG